MPLTWAIRPTQDTQPNKTEPLILFSWAAQTAAQHSPSGPPGRGRWGLNKIPVLLGWAVGRVGAALRVALPLAPPLASLPLGSCCAPVGLPLAPLGETLCSVRLRARSWRLRRWHLKHRPTCPRLERPTLALTALLPTYAHSRPCAGPRPAPYR